MLIFGVNTRNQHVSKASVLGIILNLNTTSQMEQLTKLSLIICFGFFFLNLKKIIIISKIKKELLLAITILITISLITIKLHLLYPYDWCSQQMKLHLY